MEKRICVNIDVVCGCTSWVYFPFVDDRLLPSIVWGCKPQLVTERLVEARLRCWPNATLTRFSVFLVSSAELYLTAT